MITTFKKDFILTFVWMLVVLVILMGIAAVDFKTHLVENFAGFLLKWLM